MIAIKMHGRLGNQLFQYAYAKAIQDDYNQKIVIDFRDVTSRGGKKDGWEDSLKYFCIGPYETYNGVKPLIMHEHNFKALSIYGIFKMGAQVYRKDIFKKNVYESQFFRILDNNHIHSISNGYYNFQSEKRVFLNGSFEDKRYFDKIRSTLLREFRPKEEPSLVNKKFISKINSSISVCVSIRSFSEIANSKKANLYSVVDIDYYKRAISLMKKIYPSAVFYIFSDNKDWVESNLNFEGIDYIHEPEENNVWEKLRLMYNCDHFIISNSTFSWWAQYLSRNNDKTIISPKYWFNNRLESGLLEDEWIKIE